MTLRKRLERIERRNAPSDDDRTGRWLAEILKNYEGEDADNGPDLDCEALFRVLDEIGAERRARLMETKESRP